MKYKDAELKELLGKTLVEIRGADEGDDEIIFICSDGSRYIMYHRQDCCEQVWIEDVCGDVERLLGSPITMAEDISSLCDDLPSEDEFYTWTWYKLATVRGYVTIRWYGTSNGYYSESVDFAKVVN